MRSISLINHLEFNFNGSVVRNGVALGDVDNDGNYELIVGNETGDVAIFKALDRWQTLSNLGFVSCVIVGDIFNKKRNCLVIVTADGWCFVYAVATLDHADSFDDTEQTDKSSEHGLAFSTQSLCSSRSGSIADDGKDEPKTYMKKIHAQRIPPNTKDILLGDIDGDGNVEMVLGLTDRVVRSYRWTEIPGQKTSGNDLDIIGKFVALNKWECAQQIGSISLHHSLDGIPSLLIAQPGGTFMRIQRQPEGAAEEHVTEQQEHVAQHEASSSTENLTGFSVDYQFLGISRMRNPNISTEIMGNLRTVSNAAATDSDSDKVLVRSTEETGASVDDKVKGTPYAVATLDGTIMLVQDEMILWAIAVDHQLFALTKLDVTGNGLDEIIVCSWDGHTYILDQQKNTVRFQVNESVQAFEVGYYTLIPGNAPVTCFIYITFRNKILLYFDIPLKHMVCEKFRPNFSNLKDILIGDTDDEKEELIKNIDAKQSREMVKYLLYGTRIDD